MDVDVVQTAAAVLPHVLAAVSAYGTSVLEKARDRVIDEGADATVNLGLRVLRRILGREESQQAVESAVIDVAAGEDDSDAALRLQIRKALAADAELAREVRGMLPAAGSRIEASGERSVAIGENSGVVSTGDDASIQR